MKNIPVFTKKFKVCNKRTRQCKNVMLRIGVDTGASGSFASPNGFKALQNYLGGVSQVSQETAVTPAGMTETAKTSELDICLGKKCLSDITIVPGDFGVDVMLGSDFLFKHGCIVDFTKSILRCGRMRIPFERGQ